MIIFCAMAGKSLEKLSGPARGYFLALYACPMGELGKQYLGYYKICSESPRCFAEANCLDQGNANHIENTVADALLAAEAGALKRISELRPHPVELVGQKLLSCVYISSATSRFHSRNLAPLLPVAGYRNRLLRITSVLAHDAGNFMQYLEGPALSIERMMASITRDTRHKGLIELVREPAAAREFPHWPLKYFCWELRPQADGNWCDEVFTHGDTLEANQPSPARRLLVDFWDRAQR